MHDIVKRPDRRSCLLWVWAITSALAAQPIAAQEADGNRRGSMNNLGGNPGGLPSELDFVPWLVLDRATIEAACLEDPATSHLCSPLPGGLAAFAAGTALRDFGSGSLALRGLPVGSEVVGAWVYLGVIMAEPPASLNVFFDGHAVEAALVSTAPEPCWGVGGVAAFFRAEVTDLLPKGGVGDYRVVGVPSAETAGSSADAGSLSLPLAQGATLLTIAGVPGVPDHAMVYVHETPAVTDTMLVDELNVTHGLVPSLPDWTEMTFVSFGGDGQSHDRDLALRPFNTFLSGPDRTQRQLIRGPGSTIDPVADWIGVDGGPAVAFWDTRSTRLWRQLEPLPGPAPSSVKSTSVEPPEGVPPAASSYVVAYIVHDGIQAEGGEDPRGYDCVNPAVHVLTAW